MAGLQQRRSGFFLDVGVRFGRTRFRQAIDCFRRGDLTQGPSGVASHEWFGGSQGRYQCGHSFLFPLVSQGDTGVLLQANAFGAHD